MRRFSFIISVAAVTLALAGCSDYQHQERPPWRAQAEEACLATGRVIETASIRPSPELSGPGICGAVHPFKVTALDGGTVTLDTTQTLDCPMIAALDGWMRDVVQPAALARFGEKVVQVDSMGSYNCRGINNRSGANLSEHSFANAIDIGGFVLAGGRVLSVMKGFSGRDEQERAFLHEVHAGACAHFTTVLGPGYNIFHYNHFHLDLALHGSTSRGPRRTCKPEPQTSLPGPPIKDGLPDPPAIEEEMDIARAPLPAPVYRSGPATLMAGIPPLPPRVAAASQRAVMPSAPPSAPAALAEAMPRRAPSRGDGPSAGPEPLISFGSADDAATPPLGSKPRGAASGGARLSARDAPSSFQARPRADTPPEDGDATSSITAR